MTQKDREISVYFLFEFLIMNRRFCPFSPMSTLDTRVSKTSAHFPRDQTKNKKVVSSSFAQFRCVKLQSERRYEFFCEVFWGRKEGQGAYLWIQKYYTKLFSIDANLIVLSSFLKKKLKLPSFETKKSPEEAIQKLRETEEMLNKKSEFIETKIAAELANAKKFGTKNKRQALNALKKKNRLQKQQEQIGSFFLKILITKIKNFRQHFDNNRIPARSS